MMTSLNSISNPPPMIVVSCDKRSWS